MTGHSFISQREVLSVTDTGRRSRCTEAKKVRIVEESYAAPRMTPMRGEIFCFRGRRGDLVKLLWHDGVGMSLYLKRLEAGKIIWPVSGSDETIQVSAVQLGSLLEGIDWRNPR